MSFEKRPDGGADYVARGTEHSLLRTLPPDLLLGVGAEVADLAQEECVLGEREVCELGESVQLQPDRIIFSYICHQRAACQELCELAALHSRTMAHIYAGNRMDEIAPQN